MLTQASLHMARCGGAPGQQPKAARHQQLVGKSRRKWPKELQQRQLRNAPLLASLFLLAAGAALREAAAAAVLGSTPQQAKVPEQESSLLEQHLTHSAEFDWTKPADGKFPAWLTDYVAFHRKMRGARDAKYLVNSCHKANECHFGLGDRMRGLLATVQLAIAQKRVLLVDWASPTPLEHFFLPAQVDWRLTPDLGVDLRMAAPLDRCCDRDNFSANVPAASKDAANRVWVVSTNSLPFYQVPQGVPTFRRVSWDTHSLLKALFQPSPALVEATNAEQLKLLGSLDRPFVAVHLRMGHLEGEAMDITRGWDHVHGLLAAYDCALQRNLLLNALATPPPLTNTSSSSNSSSSDATRIAAPGSHLLQQRRRRLLGTSGGAAGHVAVGQRSAQRHHARAPAGKHSVEGGRAASDEGGSRGGSWARRRRRLLRQVVAVQGGALANGPHRQHHPHLAQQQQAEGAAAGAGVTGGGSKVLLLTDHSQLRAAAARGVLAGVTGPDYLAYHLSSFHGADRASDEEHERVSLTVYVDLMLLARARCLVWSKSGFPMVAMTLGFNPCTVDVDWCIKDGPGHDRVQHHHHHHHSHHHHHQMY